MREVRIPEERVAVLIGEGGETKQRIEEDTGCSVEVEDNNVTIEGDPLEEMTAHKMVKAIGRGFNPEKAFRLVEEGFEFHHLDISKFADSQNGQERLKGRVIGRDGEARKHIENMTETDISVYGKTAGFIGYVQNIEVAQEAVKMLLNGRSHSTAYDYLERNQSRIRR
ncbi:MAG: KH domain-containing protein [Candidatus Nanohaloarchaea archaeon]